MLSPNSGEHFLQTPKNNKEIAITFDDGPHTVRTNAILDILKKEHVPATFFVVGNRLPKEANTLRRIIQEGHTLGNHSYSHPIMTKLSWIDFSREILLTNISVWLKTSGYPRYLRFPYGLADSRIHMLYSGKIVGWSVDAADWKEKNPNRLASRIIAQSKSGSIILLHDIKEDTVTALPAIIAGLKAQGYTFVSLDTLLPKKETSTEKQGIWLNSTKNMAIKQSGETISRMTEPKTMPTVTPTPMTNEWLGDEWLWNF